MGSIAVFLPRHELMSDYAWLRKKSIEHLVREKKLAGNQNAKKHGLYSCTPPAATCNACPNTATCPCFERDGACHFIWEKVNRARKRLGLG